MSDQSPESDIPLVSTKDAIAEVQQWLEVEGMDPERVFASTGDQVIRYKDLIGHLRRGTPDGVMLRFAISRGRMIRRERAETFNQLLTIAGAEPADQRRAPGIEHRETEGEPRAAGREQRSAKHRAPTTGKLKKQNTEQ
ncbi:MAG TPA: hypothetical protein VMD08_00285 [Candidatus Baltobacteraceae bacterium]|nr:hypothetical protein [Candidatus Baltobacteraceae bacterium]